MKTLRSFLALCAFAALAIVTVRADYLDLTREFFYTDNPTDVEELEASYHVFGYNTDFEYHVAVDYFFETLDVQEVMFEAWFTDTNEHIQVGDAVYGGAIEAGEDFSSLDLDLTIPYDMPGVFSVAATFWFADGTQMTEWLTLPIE